MKKDILVAACVVAIIGAVMFILSNTPSVDSVGWVLFILGAITAVVLAIVIALTSRGSRL